MTRATLHDELMHEAGFESGYYAEVLRRREERRRRVRSARHRVLVHWYRVLLVLCLLAAGANFIGVVHYVPATIAGVATAVAVVVLRADEFGLGGLLRRLGLIAEGDRGESRFARVVKRLSRRVRRKPEVGA